jgi:hypothetical protein
LDGNKHTCREKLRARPLTLHSHMHLHFYIAMHMWMQEASPVTLAYGKCG